MSAFQSVTDLGTWENYVPAVIPEDAPPRALFHRRVGDGVDWYSLSHTPGSFPAGAALALLEPVRGSWICRVLTRDPWLVPGLGGNRLLQLNGVAADADLDALFKDKVYDPAVGTFTSPPPPPLPLVSRRQFAQVLALDGKINQDEAIAWAARGELPDALEAALAQIPEAGGARFAARMQLSAATTYERAHPNVGVVGGFFGYASAALDDLWRRGSALV